MKKFFLMAFAMVAMSLAAQDVATKPFTVRYIDENRLYEQYIVAQQYIQLQNKLKTEFQQAEQKKRKEIETFYNQVQNKYQKNLYKTQKALRPTRRSSSRCKTRPKRTWRQCKRAWRHNSTPSR